jgi:hypothetical protein
MTKIDTNALDLKKEPELQLSDLNSKVVTAVAAKALQNMQASPRDFSPVGLAAKTTLLISDALKPLQAVLDLGMVLGPDVRERMIIEIAKSLGIKLIPSADATPAQSPTHALRSEDPMLRPTRLILQKRNVDEEDYEFVRDMDVVHCQVGDKLSIDCLPGFKWSALGVQVQSVLEPADDYSRWLVTVHVTDSTPVTNRNRFDFRSKMGAYGFDPLDSMIRLQLVTRQRDLVSYRFERLLRPAHLDLGPGSALTVWTPQRSQMPGLNVKITAHKPVEKGDVPLMEAALEIPDRITDDNLQGLQRKLADYGFLPAKLVSAPKELTLHCVGQPTVTISLTLPELSQLWSLSTPRAVYYHPETSRWEFEAHYLDHVRTALSGIRGTPLTQ